MKVNLEVAMNVKIITLQNVKRVHNLWRSADEEECLYSLSQFTFLLSKNYSHARPKI